MGDADAKRAYPLASGWRDPEKWFGKLFGAPSEPIVKAS